MPTTAAPPLCEISDPERSNPILLIGFVNGPRCALRDILGTARWEIREASTYQQAAHMLTDCQLGVTICDVEVGNGCWQAVLSSLQGRADPPNVIVSSRLADERLWAEVLNLGGYDVLAQPFEHSEVLRVARMAWMGWRIRCQNPAPLPGMKRMRAAT